jgi:hypothetical protein
MPGSQAASSPAATRNQGCREEKAQGNREGGRLFQRESGTHHRRLPLDEYLEAAVLDHVGAMREAHVAPECRRGDRAPGAAGRRMRWPGSQAVHRSEHLFHGLRRFSSQRASTSTSCFTERRELASGGQRPSWRSSRSALFIGQGLVGHGIEDVLLLHVVLSHQHEQRFRQAQVGLGRLSLRSGPSPFPRAGRSSAGVRRA